MHELTMRNGQTHTVCPETNDGQRCRLPTGHAGPCRFDEAEA
jgi:hypothetical protein